MASVGGDGQIRLDVKGAVIPVRLKPRYASVRLNQVGCFGPHQQMKIGQVLRMARQEVQKVPLRHQGDEFARGGQAREIADGEMAVANVQISGADFGVRQLEKVLEQTQLPHDLKG